MRPRFETAGFPLRPARKAADLRRISLVETIKMPLFFCFTTGLLAALLFPLNRAFSAQSLPPSSPSAGPSGIAKQISLEEFNKWRTQTNSTVLDVRSPGKFAAGHVPGATNINVNSSDFEKRVAMLDKEKPCLVH